MGALLRIGATVIAIAIMVSMATPSAATDALVVPASSSASVALSRYSFSSTGVRATRLIGYDTRGFLKFELPLAPDGQDLLRAELVIDRQHDQPNYTWGVFGIMPVVAANYRQGIDPHQIVGHLAPEPETQAVPFVARVNDIFDVWDVTNVLEWQLGLEVLFLIDVPAEAPEYASEHYYNYQGGGSARLILEFGDQHVPTTASSFSKIKSLYQ